MYKIKDSEIKCFNIKLLKVKYSKTEKFENHRLWNKKIHSTV